MKLVSFFFASNNFILGRYKDRQYVRGKPNDTGLKFYMIVDSNRFAWHWFLFGDDGSGYEYQGTNPKLVERLALTIPHPKESIVFADAFYGSEDAAKLLDENGIRYIFSCRKDRPSDLWTYLRARKGREPFYAITCQRTAMVWKDKGFVNFLCNFLGSSKYVEQNNKQLPEIAYWYRQHMGHVDQLDQQINVYLPKWRSTKWTQAYWMASLRIALNNSRILYNLQHQLKVPIRNWTEMIIRAIRDKVAPKIPIQIQEVGHFPLNHPKQPHDCKLCKVKTTYTCEACNLYIHPHCMKDFHLTLKH